MKEFISQISEIWGFFYLTNLSRIWEKKMNCKLFLNCFFTQYSYQCDKWIPLCIFLYLWPYYNSYAEASREIFLQNTLYVYFLSFFDGSFSSKRNIKRYDFIWVWSNKGTDTVQSGDNFKDTSRIRRVFLTSSSLNQKANGIERFQKY